MGSTPHVGEVKGKRGEALAAARELVRTSRELVALREDVPLPKTLVELHRVEPDRDQLLALFQELEFSRLADGLSVGATGAAAVAMASMGATSRSAGATADALDASAGVDDARPAAPAPVVVRPPAPPRG